MSELDFGKLLYFGVIIILILFCICYIGKYFFYVNQYYNTQGVIIEAQLLSISHKSSTIEKHIVPIIGFNGKNVTSSVAVTTSGNDESYLTIWDCGKYGRLNCEYQRVYQYAQDHSRLIIKRWFGQWIIDDIVHNVNSKRPQWK